MKKDELLQAMQNLYTGKRNAKYIKIREEKMKVPPLIMTMKLRVELTFWEALKLRLAGFSTWIEHEKKKVTIDELIALDRPKAEEKTRKGEPDAYFKD